MAKKWFNLKNVINNKDKLYYFIPTLREEKKVRLLMYSYEHIERACREWFGYTRQIKEETEI